MSEYEIMRGNEFIKKIKKLGKQRGIEVRVDSKRGKGSHKNSEFRIQNSE